MSFEPKKKIPSIAAAGLALAGCGDDPSQFEQTAGRIDRMDPTVTAFCLKYVECYPDGWLLPDVDSCRATVLGYTDAYAELSDDPEGCRSAMYSYFDCVEQASCSTAEVECTPEVGAFEERCFGEAEESP